MSRAQLVDRARRLDMRASLRVQPGRGPIGPDGLTQFKLALTFANGRFELVAHVRRVKRRRSGANRQKPSLPPARDTRQNPFLSFPEPSNNAGRHPGVTAGKALR